MMAETDLPPIHKDFDRWYGEVELRDDQGLKEARWKGVLSVVGDANRDDVEALIRLVFRTRQKAAPETLQKIRQAFKNADDAFDMQDNDRELEVLAGICLVVLMEDGKDIGAAAALAVTTAALGGARKLNVPMDLCALAESAIDHIAEENRKRPDLEDYSPSEPPKLDFKKAAAKVRETPDWNSVALAFNIAAGDVRTAMKTMTLEQADAVWAVNQFMSIQDEELQMLWWLIGQRSWDYNCSFSDVEYEARPLVFAKELADSTEFLPGPPSVKALLSRAGLEEKNSATISVVINAANQEWLEKLVGEQNPSPVSSPLHFAIQRQCETGAGDAWIAGWAAATCVNSEHSVTPLLLGELFYRERLLRKLE
ncbi:MAG: GTPase-associated system all-helical protein GASH [Bryobacterales bacterium]|nr:GTPase-associated system all-helical protein GASH [Bryobacterales bacterium]